MNKGTREQNVNNMDSPVCPECGAINDPIFTFCEECGCRLPQTDNIASEEVECRDEPVTRTPIPSMQNTPVEASQSKKKIKTKKSSHLTRVLMLILIVIVAGGYVGRHVQAMAPEEPAQIEEEVITVEEPPIHELEQSQVSIVSSDWDWDSCRENNGTYQVDYILLVSNGNNQPLSEIEFNVKDKAGMGIVDSEANGGVLHATGLVAAGSTSVMIGEVNVSKKKVKPDTATYEITKAMTNNKLDDYKLPEGKISRCHGDKNDYYDISVVNTNGVTISENSRVVAVYLKDGKIKESDATGEIAVGIGPGESLNQKDAFYDPHFCLYQKNKGKYQVFVIDEQYLKT